MLLNYRLRSQYLCYFLTVAVAGLVSSMLLSAEKYTEDPGKKGNGNFVIGPKYQIAPDLTDLGNPKGKHFEFEMPLADSKIFPGTDKTLDPKKPHGPGLQCVGQPDDLQRPRTSTAGVYRDWRPEWR